MRKRNGFTLIELLVVVAIISLLVSILVPSLRRAKDMAKAVVCATNLKHIGLGYHFYGQDNDGWLPANLLDYMYTPYILYIIPPNDSYYNDGLLYRDKYITNGRVFFCPGWLKEHGSGYETNWYWSYDPPSTYTGGSYVRATYYPWFSRKPFGGTQSSRLEEVGGSQTALNVDNINWPLNFGHPLGSDDPVYNVLYGDGGVARWRDHDGRVLNLVPSGELSSLAQVETMYDWFDRKRQGPAMLIPI